MGGPHRQDYRRTTKKCGGCGEIKSITEFSYKETVGHYQSHCKLCRNFKSREWYNNNKERVRSNQLKYNYNMPIKWEQLFDQQGKVCALCGSNNPKHKSGWRTDHNPQTGIVRGILCHSCNIGLGHYEKCKENPKLEDYLARGKIRKIAAE